MDREYEPGPVTYSWSKTEGIAWEISGSIDARLKAQLGHLGVMFGGKLSGSTVKTDMVNSPHTFGKIPPCTKMTVQANTKNCSNMVRTLLVRYCTYNYWVNVQSGNGTIPKQRTYRSPTDVLMNRQDWTYWTDVHKIVSSRRVTQEDCMGITCPCFGN